MPGITDFYQDIIDDAHSFYGNPANQPQYYTGPTVAPFNPAQEQAFQAGTEAAGAQTGIAGQYGDVVSRGLSGGYSYDPATYEALSYDNPFLHQQATQLGQQAAAGANLNAAGAGTLGGTRAALAAGEAAGRAVTPLYAGAYDRYYNAEDTARARNAAAQNQANQFNVNTISGFGQNVPQLQTAFGTGANTLYNIGTNQRNVEQDILDQDIRRFNYTQSQPGLRQQQLLGLGALQQSAEAGYGQTPGLDIFNDPGGYLSNAVKGGIGNAIGAGVNSLIGNILPF